LEYFYNNFIKGIVLKDLYAFMKDLETKVVDKDGKEKSKNSVSTRARKVACLKSYFNYLQNKAKIITVIQLLNLKVLRFQIKRSCF
jgi:hypothetical protein